MAGNERKNILSPAGTFEAPMIIFNRPCGTPSIFVLLVPGAKVPGYDQTSLTGLCSRKPLTFFVSIYGALF
jgi:hypothetical protein